MNKTDILADRIVNTLNIHKGIDIVKIDLRKLENTFCCFFIVCHGTSNSQVTSLSDYVYNQIHAELQEKPIHVEGEREALWIVMDYGDVVVHIFQKEQREFYQLEEFWADAEITKIEE